MGMTIRWVLVLCLTPWCLTPVEGSKLRQQPGEDIGVHGSIALTRSRSVATGGIAI
jgi:hypothetical protein